MTSVRPLIGTASAPVYQLFFNFYFTVISISYIFYIEDRFILLPGSPLPRQETHRPGFPQSLRRPLSPGYQPDSPNTRPGTFWGLAKSLRMACEGRSLENASPLHSREQKRKFVVFGNALGADFGETKKTARTRQNFHCPNTNEIRSS